MKLMRARCVCPRQVLRMCEGSPQRFVHDPIVKYLSDRGVAINLNSKAPARGRHRVAYKAVFCLCTT